MNVKINGSIASISETDTFQYNGSTFNFKNVIVNAPAFNNTTVPVCVKVNIDKTDLSNVKVGNIVQSEGIFYIIVKNKGSLLCHTLGQLRMFLTLCGLGDFANQLKN